MTAVAGAGKSHMLIARILDRLYEGVPAERLLVLMFNNSAMNAFDARLKCGCKSMGASAPEVLTFHGFGQRLCKRLEARGAIQEATLLTDEMDLYRVMRAAIVETNSRLAASETMDASPELIRELLDLYDLVTGSMEEELPEVLDDRWRQTLAAFKAMRQQHGFRTYIDLITDPLRAIAANSALKRFVADRYDEILIDEFQDVNEAQVQLVAALAGTRATVIAVGDDDQTIYRWRGARPEYMISKFEQMFPGSRRFALTHSFRFGKNIAAIAERIIANNRHRVPKGIGAGPDRDDRIEVRSNPPWQTSGRSVAEALLDWTRSQRSVAEAAVLVREFALTVSVEPALLLATIPYRVIGAPPFFERAEALLLEAYVILAEGCLPSEEAARQQLFRRWLTWLPPGISSAERDALATTLANSRANPVSILQQAGRTYNDHRGAQLFAAARQYENLQKNAGQPAAKILMDAVSDAQLFAMIEKRHARREIVRNKHALLNEMLSISRLGGANGQDFLTALADMRNRYAAAASSARAVTITSIHRSKGLEWPLVILPELQDGAFPSAAVADALEDERRLMYVAITRASERVVFCAPLDANLERWASSGQAGSPSGPHLVASRFLYEAGATLLESTGRSGLGMRGG